MRPMAMPAPLAARQVVLVFVFSPGSPVNKNAIFSFYDGQNV
jgi:hypothetical protein